MESGEEGEGRSNVSSVLSLSRLPRFRVLHLLCTAASLSLSLSTTRTHMHCRKINEAIPRFCESRTAPHARSYPEAPGEWRFDGVEISTALWTTLLDPEDQHRRCMLTPRILHGNTHGTNLPPL